MPIFSSKLTYGDFRRTGEQDCRNVIDYDDFDFDAGTPEQIIEKAFAEWEADGMEEQWLSQQDDDFDDLDPHKCFEAWKSGWQGAAHDYIKHHLAELKKDRDYDDARENPPANWWRRPAPPKDRTCYRTKIEALTKFLEANRQIIENYGGADYKVSPSEFDSVNHKYNLTGKKAVRTIADAVWVAMPVGKPYCLDRIDLEALNDTSPARESGSAFVLPDSVYAAQMAEQEMQHYSPVVSVEDIPEPDWVTEHVQFPPLPRMPEGPVRMHLDKRDSISGSRGVETYKILPPLPPMPDIKPYKVELEEQEPGVATFRFNPSDGGFAGRLRERRALQQAIREYLASTPADMHTEDDVVESLVESTIECDGAEFTPSAEMVRSVYRGMTPGAELQRNPPEPAVAIGNVYNATTADGPTTFQVIGYFYVGEERRWRVRWADGHLSALNMLHFAGYGARFSHHDFVAEPKIGNPARVPVDNPAWVTSIISKHYEQLQDNVPAKWLPKLTKPTTSHGKITAAMKEYGCGAYGCVLPTLDKDVVLKLTTDETEAQFAHELADKLTVPVVVKYHLVRALPDKYKTRPAFLLWRDSADHVDKVEQTIAENGDVDVRAVEKAIAAQHKAAQKAFDALHAGRDATKLLQKWEDACREMGVLVPELSELAEGMITNLHNNKVFFGDVHSGNIGMVNGRWVVVDPGHVAVLEE